MVPKVFVDILMGALRYALFGVGVWLAERNIATPEQFEQVIGAITLMVVTLVWMIWAKVREKQLFNTAASLADETPAQIARMVRQGVKAKATAVRTEVPTIQQQVYSYGDDPYFEGR